MTAPTAAGQASYAGGLVGDDAGSITGSFASGSVSGQNVVGGLVGNLEAGGSITQAYALGPVSGASQVGGLAGQVDGAAVWVAGQYSTAEANYAGPAPGPATVSQTYATGAVTGSGQVGGLVGANAGSVTASYWDTQTTGQASSAAGAGLTTAQFFNGANLAGFSFGTTPGGNGWVIVDADGTLNNAGGVVGGTRPMLLSE